MDARTVAAEMEAPLDLSQIETLKVGDHGETVRQAHRFFIKYGYFENEVLKQAYPEWSPIVAAVPRDLNTFGPELEAAVSAYQARAGMEATGIIDAPMIEHMQSRFCAVPDSFDEGIHAKYHLSGPYLLSRIGNNWPQVKYWILNKPANLSEESVDGAIRASIAAWGAAPVKAESLWTSHILFRWANAAAPGDVAQTSADGATITFNSAQSWTAHVAAPGAYVVRTIATHEFGHVMGFGHASRTDIDSSLQVMWPFVNANKDTPNVLSQDEQQALLATDYSGWYFSTSNVMSASVTSLSSAKNDNRVWVIDKSIPAELGYHLMRWDNASSSWVAVNRIGGVKVVMSNSTPATAWVLTQAGDLYRRTNITSANPNGNASESIATPTKTRDIAACPGSMNVYRMEAVGGFGGDPNASRVQKFDGVAGWINLNIGGVELAVAGRSGPQGYLVCDVWVIKADRGIWRLEGGVPVQKPGRARAIAAGPFNQVWITGDTLNTNRPLYVWNEQPSGGGEPPAPALARWQKTSGEAVGITVGRDGPWVWTSGAGDLYMRALRQ